MNLLEIFLGLIESLTGKEATSESLGFTTKFEETNDEQKNGMSIFRKF